LPLSPKILGKGKENCMSTTNSVWNDPKLQPIIMATPHGCYYNSVTLRYEPYDPILSTDAAKLHLYAGMLRDVRDKTNASVVEEHKEWFGKHIVQIRTDIIARRYRLISPSSTEFSSLFLGFIFFASVICISVAMISFQSFIRTKNVIKL